MGFLNFWRSQPQDRQGELLKPESSALADRTEPSRLGVYHRLHDGIAQRGGEENTHADVNRLANRIVLGERTDELYAALNLKPSERSKLPAEAKEALLTGDIAAYYQIQEDDAQGHFPIVHSARKGYQKAAKLFPWNKS